MWRQTSAQDRRQSRPGPPRLGLNLADEVTIPAASGVLREVARLDPPLDGAVLPEPEHHAAQKDRRSLKCDVLVGERHPAERPPSTTARPPAQLRLSGSLPLGQELVDDLLDNLRRQAQQTTAALGEFTK